MLALEVLYYQPEVVRAVKVCVTDREFQTKCRAPKEKRTINDETETSLEALFACNLEALTPLSDLQSTDAVLAQPCAGVSSGRNDSIG